MSCCYIVWVCTLFVLFLLCFFFFKQKTAYEMRISDWSSDVCSSDLRSQSFWRTLFRAVQGQAALHAAHARYVPLAGPGNPLCGGCGSLRNAREFPSAMGGKCRAYPPGLSAAQHRSFPGVTPDRDRKSVV